MTDEQEPRGKIIFSNQSLDMLTSQEAEVGEQVGAYLRGLLVNPTVESPTRRRLTRGIREEDMSAFSNMRGQRVAGYYHEVKPNPPFIPLGFYFAMLFTHDYSLTLQTPSEEDLRRIGFPQRDNASDEEIIVAHENIHVTFEAIEAVDKRVIVHLRQPDGSLEQISAISYGLMDDSEDDLDESSDDAD